MPTSKLSEELEKIAELHPDCPKCHKPLQLLSYDDEDSEYQWLCIGCDEEFRLDHNNLPVRSGR